MTFPEVGAAMGTTEEAARKRVDRAVAKLREMATARGLTMPAGAFAAILWTNMATEAATPVGLVAMATTCGFGTGTGVMPAAISLAQGATMMMAWTKMKVALGIAVAMLVLGGIGTGVVTQLAAQDEPQAQAPAEEAGPVPLNAVVERRM